MPRILITGSSTGLGLMAAQLLIAQGHQVVVHGRDQTRAADAMAAAPGAEAAVAGDLSSLTEMKAVAEQANALGPYLAVIHNAGLGYREPKRIETAEGIPELFAVNVLAPYVLTALIAPPARLVYLSSGMHRRVEPDFDDLFWRRRRWDGSTAYAETKFHDVLLAFAVARLWPAVRANALEPGWVPTRMGGAGAPDDINKGHVTQAWLATSDDALALSTGDYFAHHQLRAPNPLTRDETLQTRLLAACESVSGIALPLAPSTDPKVAAPG